MTFNNLYKNTMQKDYIFQLVLKTEEDYYPLIYTDKIKCLDDNDAYQKIMDWTYTKTDKSSEEFDIFDMYINGESLNNFINK